MAWEKISGGFYTQTEWDQGATLWDEGVGSYDYTQWDLGASSDTWTNQDTDTQSWSKQAAGSENWT